MPSQSKCRHISMPSRCRHIPKRGQVKAAIVSSLAHSIKSLFTSHSLSNSHGFPQYSTMAASSSSSAPTSAASSLAHSIKSLFTSHSYANSHGFSQYSIMAASSSSSSPTSASALTSGSSRN